jgi:hypothetical protein
MGNTAWLEILYFGVMVAPPEVGFAVKAGATKTAFRLELRASQRPCCKGHRARECIAKLRERKDLGNRQPEPMLVRGADECPEVLSASSGGCVKGGPVPDGFEQVQLGDGIGDKPTKCTMDNRRSSSASARSVSFNSAVSASMRFKHFSAWLRFV